MKAVCWNGVNDVRVENVPDPRIINPHDCIVKTSLTAICGSDLHLYNGYIPAMMKGDILGHGRGSRSWTGGTKPQDRRPRGGAIPDLLWPLLLLPAGFLVVMR